MATIHANVIQELFVTGLVNAHAVEKQALSIMTPQLERIEHYPEVADQLRRHIDEMHQQIARIDELLSSFGEKSSLLKDTGLSLSGTFARWRIRWRATRSSRTASPITRSSISRSRHTSPC